MNTEVLLGGVFNIGRENLRFFLLTLLRWRNPSSEMRNYIRIAPPITAFIPNLETKWKTKNEGKISKEVHHQGQKWTRAQKAGETSMLSALCDYRVFACTFGSFSLGPLQKALSLGKGSGDTFLRKASQVPGTDLSIYIIMIHVGLIQLGTVNSDMCLQVHPQQDLHSQKYHIPSLPKVPND